MNDTQKTKAQLLEEVVQLRQRVAELETAEAACRHTAETLRQREQLLRSIAQNYPNSYLSIIDAGYTVGFSAGQEFKKQGLDPQQFEGSTLEQVFGEQATIVRQHYERTFRGESCSFELFTNNQHQLYRTVPLYAEDGSIPRILAVVENITERKQVEEALQASEERLQLALDAAQMGQWEWNIVTGEVVWSQQCLALYGLPPETPMDYERFLQVVHPEDRERIDVALRRAVEDRSGYDEPKRAVWPDGSIHWTASRGQVYCDAAGQPIRMLGVTFDISQWKETEESLQKSHEELRAFFSQTIDGCFFMMLDDPVRWDETIDQKVVLDYVFAHQHMTRINEAMMAQYGATREQLLRLTPNDFFKHNPAHGRDLWRRLFDAGKIRLESDERKLDGTPMWIEGEYIVLYDAEGRITGHFGIQRDVTERKQLERALATREGEYRTLIESVPDFIVRYNRDLRRTYVNPAWEKASGLSREEVINVPASGIPKVSHPVVDAYMEKLQQVLATGISEAIEFTWTNAYGVLLFLDYIIVPEYDRSGEIVGVLAVGRDITEHKRAEKRLRLLTRAVEQSADSIIITDTVGNIEYVNPKFTALTGYSSDEVMGKNPRILKSDWTSPEEYARLWQTITAGGEWRGEFHNKKKDGTLYWESASISPVRDGTGTITHFVAAKADITDRKNAEQALWESETRYRSLFEDSPVSLWEQDFSAVKTYLDQLSAFGVTDLGVYFAEHPEAISECVAKVKLVQVNQATCALYGAPNKDALLTGLDQYLPEEARAIFRDEVIAFANGETRFERENVNRTLTGDMIDCVVTVSIAPGYEYTWEKVFVSISDITARKQMEETLRESERRLRLIVQNMPVMMDAFDADGNILAWNKECERITGYREDEIVGNPRVMESLYPDTSYRERMMAEWAARGNDFYHWEWDITSKDGSVKTISWSNIADRFPIPGWATWALGVDITGHKQAEQRQLQLALEKEHGETFRTLMSNIAHDLKTPLAIINTSLYLLEKHADPAKRQEKVDIIKGQIRLLDSFIQDLLAMARLDSEPQLRLMPVDVNELVMGLEADHHDIIAQKRLTFALDLQVTLLPIQADQTDLRRAFANLVENAIHYTPETGSVTVRTYKQTKDVVVEVIDTGIGIGNDALPHIFDRFYRSTEAQALTGTGSGLGLAIVKRVIEMHGGTVEVDSAPGKGTTFRVLLPA